jgi:hypothetical protein
MKVVFLLVLLRYMIAEFIEYSHTDKLLDDGGRILIGLDDISNTIKIFFKSLSLLKLVLDVLFFKKLFLLFFSYLSFCPSPILIKNVRI